MTLDAYRDTFRFAARYWLLSPRLFGLMIVARIASNLVDIFVPLASGALVDTLASGGGDPTAALRALARLIGLVVAFHALRTFVAWALIYVSSRAMEALVRDAFARVQRFSSDRHANSFAGATVLICGFLVVILGLMPGLVLDGFAQSAAQETVRMVP